MSQKIEGSPPSSSIRAVAAPAGSAAASRAGDARDKAIEGPAAGDSLRLTGEATGLQAMQRELAARPAVDETRVQAVREALASGTYRIDAEAIASKMLEMDAQVGD